jgi:hypothetical protein
MKHKVTVIDPQILIPQLLELLEETDAVPLLISGNSMSPFLIHSRDTVYLSKITTPPQRGDMILYRRSTGQYVLHRVYAAGDTFTMVGDAQTLLEKGIRPEQMLARVSAVCRKGKLLRKGDFWWNFFETAWLRMLSARPFVHQLYSRFHHTIK